ncbi:MAG: iro [Candidatus Eremiobacteraeota bacterium]|nr:iro [Candidatus Eremiobacteraeota bacterium]
MKSSVSRGRALKGLAALPFAALAVSATLSTAQGATDNKKQFKYQDKPGPKGQICAGCRFFRKPNACTIVHGKISPNGWCIAWAK